MAEVTLKGVLKDFGSTRVIHGVDLQIKDRELIVFVGPSGCGKSTLLRLIAGLEDISGGDMFIDGECVNQRSPKERKIAMVFQSYALYPHMSVYENMAFGLELSKHSKESIKEKVMEAARILELTPLLERKPKQLSGGQRQRVAIGRAIVRNPQVFLFDEPLSNLDASLRVQMRIEIAKLHQDMDVTMVYVTHDQVEAMTLADRIVVLNAGRIEQVGSPLELYHRPRNKFVAGFIGSPKMNFIEAKVVGVAEDGIEVSVVGSVAVKVPVDPAGLSVGDSVEYGIRPEHMTAGPEGELAGKVEVIEELGESHFLHVRLVNGPLVTVQGRGDAKAKCGESCMVRLDRSHSHVFGGDGFAVSKIGTLGQVEMTTVLEGA
ncbi:sn-glycerol-3-phosphate ABC transporter ATP-binding protein UgpC [Pseudovibrio sp. Tun.PSC04-5.I4]|uniref:ABC transporter ATP-binding protein n=1 Tax=Pseudovibrio sp. Tun.PSC04-5.I4 TaxID=1798213 RepID=UPI0008864F79|nr:sn-glycerol-3-phosphate ABC transporter ATP-binding protein UgpC [Pseudovibrio sp. Tun.PSC04-5.I4]SDR33645.1 multiple sugar transport system ATP-binding protein [Pseudovibrio sp. Tun.PSC04-5.I4]